ncbi:MAG: hypothetical protein RPT11_01800, partial [Bermanella sp.]
GNGNGNENSDCEIVLGGWALVVVYEHDDLPFQVTNIFDGYKPVFNNTGEIILRLSNFIVAPNPTGKHAHITFEGDPELGSTKENLKFQGNLLTDTYNQAHAQFNSVSNIYAGSTHSTDTLGVDVDAYDISSYLSPGNTFVETSYETGGDTVLLMAEVISVSNFPVADLEVKTTAPNQWQANSSVTQKFTVTNNGPSDVPSNRSNFTVTLPSNLIFDGTQASSHWLCDQDGQQLDCIYQEKLRSGWSVYIDINLIVGDVANSDITLSANVNHDNGSNDILDNVPDNNAIEFTVAISAEPVIDLSASSKRPIHENGDSLLAGQTLKYIITIDDASGLPVTGISVIDNLPLNISGYTITSALPPNAVDNSTYKTVAEPNVINQLSISGLDLADNGTLDIELEVYINTDAPKGASLHNTATITYQTGNPVWVVDTGNITVVEYDLNLSSKQGTDLNGDTVEQEDVIRYVINIKDAGGLSISGLQLTDHLPANFSSFSIVSMPTGAVDNSNKEGGDNGSGLVNISNIDVALGQEVQVIIDATISKDAPQDSSLINTATLTLDSSSWTIISNEIIVNKEVDISTSGNKPLYLTTSDLTRIIPSTDHQYNITGGNSTSWSLSPTLQSDLILNAGDLPLNLVIGGTAGNNSNAATVTARFYFSNDGGDFELSTATFPSAVYDNGVKYNKAINLNISKQITIPSGATLHLDITNNHSDDTIGIHSYNGIFYSSLILNAATVINVDSITVWDAPYGDVNASVLTEKEIGGDFYIRVEVTDPFGAFDITKADIVLSKNNSDVYYSKTVDDTENTNLLISLAENKKTYQFPITVSDTESITGFWNIYIKAYEGMESGTKQVTHERTTRFLIKPFYPIMTLNKSVRVVSDPINASINPKAIPGAILAYTIHAENSGKGSPDNNSIILQDEIPANSKFFIGNIDCVTAGAGPICFIDGTGSDTSGLTYAFTGFDDAINGVDDISFSKSGTDFNYQPDLANGDYDAEIRFIRINPKGVLNNLPEGSGYIPQFDFSYQVQLQ